MPGHEIQRRAVQGVALLAEGVDRNDFCRRGEGHAHVALLAEGVDRNVEETPFTLRLLDVALLAEGVDRNAFRATPPASNVRSPSSQRAWIEIMRFGLLPISD